MINRAIVALVLGMSVTADAAYNVVLGSFRNTERAEKARNEASAMLGSDVTVTGSETPSGYRYRVLVGLFVARAEADAYARVARDRGFEGAWVTNAAADGASYRSTQTLDDTFAPSETLFELDEALVDSSAFALDDAFEDLADDVDSDYPALEELPVAAAPPSRSYELPAPPEPPAGYQLHKLRRR